MQSREWGGRRPGNEARCNLGECEVIFDIRMDAEGTLVAGSMERGLGLVQLMAQAWNVEFLAPGV